MKKRTTIIATFIAVAAGAAIAIVAVQQAWFGEATPSGAGAPCPHTIAAADCPFCTPSLIESKGWCVEHAVPEALCTRCDASVIAAFQASGDWCAEHELPESQCMICNPELAATDGDAELPPPSVRLVDATDLPRARRAPSVSCQTESLRIQFRSAEVARVAGIEFARVERRETTETRTCNAELAYDGNRYARLSSRAAGVVREVPKDLGQRVAAGDVLAVVDSAELGTTKADLLQAQALVALWERNHAREQGLLERRVATERDVLEAETKLTESRISLARATQRLRNLGLSDEEIASVAKEEDTSSLLALSAPFAGIVVERSAVSGEIVDTATPLIAIADTSRLWVNLDVLESDVVRVQPGQHVIVEIDGLPGDRRSGDITWVSSRVDPRTRTLEARAEIANDDGLLRAGMFGRAIVHVRDRIPALVVPKDAVQWEGCCHVVFVRRSDVLFEPRKVRLGYETAGHWVVEEGLSEGEAVVTTGSFLLKTEILKGSIGAGCCEVGPERS